MKIILGAISIIALAIFSGFTVVSCAGSDRTPSGGEISQDAAQDESKTATTLEEVQEESQIMGEISETEPMDEGHIMIANVGDFKFNPRDIKTVREDIFINGHFSIFDIMVHLDDTGQIDMEYHFDEDMNTHVIDSINDRDFWWHIAYYDGGWPERNVFRADHYPYKDRMYISIVEVEEREVEAYYEVFRNEIKRKNDNDGKVIVPEVIINGPQTGRLTFENVEVKPHDLRNDMFAPETITAIDAIMTLGDEGKIRYVLNWYESVGTAGVVKNYFVDGINDDISSGRCGFVYEEGSLTYNGFAGNHIHIPSDARVINSPEYIEYFWICI
jgi:hypothetical protein